MFVENSDFLPLHSMPSLEGPRRNSAITFGMEQKISYRKQIARMLRTHTSRAPIVT